MVFNEERGNYMKRKLSVFVSLLAVTTLVLTGCGGGGTGGDSGTAKTEIVVAHGADAKSLDPHGTNDQPSSRVMNTDNFLFI